MFHEVTLKYGLRMKCPPTSFFEFEETDSESLDIEIDANKVDGDLNLEAYVFAPKEVPRFTGELNRIMPITDFSFGQRLK